MAVIREEDDETEYNEDLEKEDLCDDYGHEFSDEGVCERCGEIDEPDDFSGATEGDR